MELLSTLQQLAAEGNALAVALLAQYDANESNDPGRVFLRTRYVLVNSGAITSDPFETHPANAFVLAAFAGYLLDNRTTLIVTSGGSTTVISVKALASVAMQLAP